MTTYTAVNAVWPKPHPVPTPQEAISGTKALIRFARKLATQDGREDRWVREYKFKLTSGRRHGGVRGGTWYVNPNLHRHWGWHHLVHQVSHWAKRHYWPKAPDHGLCHAWVEAELANYAINNLIEGQLRRPEKPKADPVVVRRERVDAAIKRWEGKKRRAENALRKLRRQERYYGRTTGRLVRDTRRPVDTEVLAAAA
jgi:hypothetical protein